MKAILAIAAVLYSTNAFADELEDQIQKTWRDCVAALDLGSQDFAKGANACRDQQTLNFMMAARVQHPEMFRKPR